MDLIEITISSDFATESQTSGLAFKSDNTSTTDISQESSLEKENLTGIHKFHLWISLKSQFLQILPQKDKQVGSLSKETTLQKLTQAKKTWESETEVELSKENLSDNLLSGPIGVQYHGCNSRNFGLGRIRSSHPSCFSNAVNLFFDHFLLIFVVILLTNIKM